MRHIAFHENENSPTDGQTYLTTLFSTQMELMTNLPNGQKSDTAYQPINHQALH